MIKAEYVWFDGDQPTQTLRSKTRTLPEGTTEPPRWSFDGSSTNQAEGHRSDCLLEPVFTCPDPLRGDPHKLVLCEVLDIDGAPHRTNTRAPLREAADRHRDQDTWVGIEQEYTMFKGSRPLGWPAGGYPAPQGPFYCGVGADEVFGREIAEEHLDACLAAGLKIYGINAEVMPGQWEFQVGTGGPVEISDHLVLARYLLYRVGEGHNTSMTLHPKPVRGDWNGSGAHTNFSTAAMRAPGGLAVIHEAIKRLEANHAHHIAHYGDGIEQRLTGKHETCSYKEFRFGDSDRGASIRIPPSTVSEGRGYFEDRRPCANVDPYVVTRLLLETICD
ncbi:MAG TPA: glutamine synthetase [Deltaproteobacteria bacterium]|nr:glutamine synthetase [Deltaproteobacteria bacterium]